MSWTCLAKANIKYLSRRQEASPWLRGGCPCDRFSVPKSMDATAPLSIVAADLRLRAAAQLAAAPRTPINRALGLGAMTVSLRLIGPSRSGCWRRSLRRLGGIYQRTGRAIKRVGHDQVEVLGGVSVAEVGSLAGTRSLRPGSAAAVAPANRAGDEDAARGERSVAAGPEVRGEPSSRRATP